MIAKPIGWMLTDRTYNDDIRVKVGLELPVEAAEVMHSAYHVYTDGSYTGARNTHARSLRYKQRKHVKTRRRVSLKRRLGGRRSSTRKGHHHAKKSVTH